METLAQPSEWDLVPATELTIAQLQERIEKKYYVRVVFGAYCDPFRNQLSDHKTVTDEEMIKKSMLMIDEQLSLYPQGFLKQLSLGSNTPLHIVLVNSLIHYDGTAAAGITIIVPYFSRSNPVIMLDIGESNWITDFPHGSHLPTGAPFTEFVIHHEISHVMDYLMQKDKNYRTLWEGWPALLPPAFEYGADMYSEKHVYLMTSGDIYFCDLHSKTNRLEHHANIFGYAMSGTPPEALANPHIQAQLRYYFSVIRQAFGAGWTEIPYWEKSLI
jgi:hypothetical protein